MDDIEDQGIRVEKSATERFAELTRCLSDSAQSLLDSKSSLGQRRTEGTEARRLSIQIWYYISQECRYTLEFFISPLERQVPNVLLSEQATLELDIYAMGVCHTTTMGVPVQGYMSERLDY